MKNFMLWVLPLMVTGLSAQVNRKLCITVDDLPTVSYGIDHEEVITEGILKAFKKHSVPAIGYVNASKLFRKKSTDAQKINYLKDWLEAGMELGNHTFSHKNYHRVLWDEYARDITEGEKVVKALVESYGQEYRFFRHPYLRSGRDSLETHRLKNFLEVNGYQESFVTVDNDDYLFALAYANAYKQKDEKLMKKIGDTYLTYMVEKLQYFEKNSIKLFGRNVNHTLLIHANFLNATYLDRLLTRFEDLGYSFISQEEAMSDSAYQTPVTTFGDWGISWLDRWALSAGEKGAFFREEPITPQFIVDLAH